MISTPDASPPAPVLAVRAIILNEAREALLLRRHPGHTGAGGWCLPGGKVDYGETLEQAVRREVHEETGLECRTVEFFACQDGLPVEDGAMHCVSLYFVCTVTGSLRATPESDGIAWVGVEDLPRYHVVFRNGLALEAFWGGAPRRGTQL